MDWAAKSIRREKQKYRENNDLHQERRNLEDVVSRNVVCSCRANRLSFFWTIVKQPTETSLTVPTSTNRNRGCVSPVAAWGVFSWFTVWLFQPSVVVCRWSQSSWRTFAGTEASTPRASERQRPDLFTSLRAKAASSAPAASRASTPSASRWEGSVIVVPVFREGSHGAVIS